MVTDTYENEERSERCEGTAVTVGEQSVPSVAIRWAVHNSFTNVELASLSNVSRHWREIVAQCVVESKSMDGGNGQTSVRPLPPTYTRLLLPSMVRKFYASCSNSQSPQSEEEREYINEEDNETYCVAWFHPGGIRFKYLPLQSSSPDASQECGQHRQKVSVLYRWESYTKAIDILKPFGYSQFFLQVSLRLLGILYIVCQLVDS